TSSITLSGPLYSSRAVRAAKLTYMPDPTRNPGQGTNNREKNVWRQIGRYSNLGMILPASGLAGLVIGALLDRWLKTSWITLVGLLLGCVVGFIELIRGAMRAGKES